MPVVKKTTQVILFMALICLYANADLAKDVSIQTRHLSLQAAQNFSYLLAEGRDAGKV